MCARSWSKSFAEQATDVVLVLARPCRGRVHCRVGIVSATWQRWSISSQGMTTIIWVNPRQAMVILYDNQGHITGGAICLEVLIPDTTTIFH